MEPVQWPAISLLVYDTVLMPVSKQMQSMMVRNLLYTAITRAKKEVMPFGDPDALDSAMQRVPHVYY